MRRFSILATVTVLGCFAFVSAVSISTPTSAADATSGAETPSALHAYAPTVDPGQTPFSVADRLAITNLIYAYALAWDNYETDTWFSFFTPDAIFVASQPGMKPVSFTGAEFHHFWGDRLTHFKSSGNQRRHLMSNILFLDETAASAHVSILALLTNVKDGKAFTVETSLNYEGWFVKSNGAWKIKRWHDFPDSGVAE